MTKKTMDAAGLLREIEIRYLQDDDVKGGARPAGLPVAVQGLPICRNGVNWQAVFGTPAAYGEAMARAIAAAQTEYSLERPFPGSSAAAM